MKRRMQGSLAGDLARLPALSREELVTEWRMLFGTEPPCRISQPLMLRALAYQFQAQAMGGLKPAVSRELKAIAEKGLQRTQAPPSLSPGTRLLREWHGQTHEVLIAEDGVQYRGERYRSLSQVAQVITGTRWSGPQFFGLKKEAA